VKMNNEESGNYDFFNYRDALASYNYLRRTYNLVKACIMKLAIRCDYSVIKILADEGYVISIKENEYDASLEAASRKSDNLATKIKSKQKEIDNYTQTGDKKPMTFVRALAKLSYKLKYNVDPNITLSGYNELIKQWKEEHASRNRSAGFNNR
jgi:hypothetical protein